MPYDTAIVTFLNSIGYLDVKEPVELIRKNAQRGIRTPDLMVRSHAQFSVIAKKSGAKVSHGGNECVNPKP